MLADDADSLTHGAVQGARPARDEQARPHAGDRRRPGGRGGHPPHPVAGPLPRRGHRRGAGLHRPQPAALDRRPDRRHQELRPRRPGLGDPDRAGRRRRGRARRRVRARSCSGAGGPRRATAPGPAARCSRRPSARSPTYAASRTPRCPTPRCPAGTSAAGSTTSSSLSRRCWRTRAYGDFWSYMLLAEGAVDMAAEPELELYDMAALDVIVREAGGRFTSLDGTDGPFGGNALATNGHLHEAALSFLGSLPRRRRRPRLAPARARLGARPARRRQAPADDELAGLTALWARPCSAERREWLAWTSDHTTRGGGACASATCSRASRATTSSRSAPTPACASWSPCSPSTTSAR